MPTQPPGQEIPAQLDGLTFAIGAAPLPNDHWIYGPILSRDVPVFTCADLEMDQRKRIDVQEAIRDAIRNCTFCGVLKFDPDDLQKNLMANLFGSE